jgi:UDP-glucose 4-epimerase
MYGPSYDPTRSSLVGRLVHAAVKGEKPSLEGMRFMSVNAEYGGDQCYIKDAAQGIALLQTAEKLNHIVYNISDGRPTTNQQIVDAIQRVIPEFELELPAGHATNAPLTSWRYDISRVHEDTGYQPKFDVEAGVADYIHWLQQGSER